LPSTSTNSATTRHSPYPQRAHFRTTRTYFRDRSSNSLTYLK
jgi:hypothetical protein